MAAIVYLDADDEITSAASRIRSADDKRIALVVPYGSRLATSRINFRLLAREAQAHGYRLAVVAGDAATRALAASAGLPVFASVGAYEENETVRPGRASPPAAPGIAEDQPPGPRRRRASGAAAGAAAAAASGAAGVAAGPEGAAPAADGSAGPAVAHGRPGEPGADLDQTQAIPVAPARGGRGGRGPAAAAAGSAAAAGAAGAAAATTRAPTAAPPDAGAAAGTATSRSDGATAGTRTLPWRGGRPVWPYGQTAAVAVAALVGLGLLALAVGAYLLLPSASATVTVRAERVGPAPMEIRADPDAAAPDPAAGAIPAQRLTFDVAASGTFPSSGRRVEETRARGQVRFQSKNPFDENNVRAGSIVSTPGGVQFRTVERVLIPTATFVGLTVVPGEATVAVEAVNPGPAGNVAAGAITVVPSDEDAEFTLVTNLEPTSGGSRREFPRVEQADVDAAIAQLAAQLDDEFATILADPARVPPGLTMFGETRQLAEPLPTTDPSTLVGQEVEEFELGLAATGTAIAVDPRPLERVAATRMERSVPAGYRLVPDSVQVAPGEPEVTGQTVTFPVSVTASQIRVVDAATIRQAIRGKPLADARSILEGYGEAELSVWPDWVTTIPTLDARLDVRVRLPSGIEPGSGSPGPSGTADPSTGAGSPGPGSASPSVEASPVGSAAASDAGGDPAPSAPSSP